MIQFKIISTGEVKSAFSYREDGNKIYITFSRGGTEYGYSKKNIQLILESANEDDLVVYSYQQQCYKCHCMTEVLTYVIFSDETAENVVFPWDKDRLLKYQRIEAHIIDSSIEYYGLHVIGEIDALDRVFMDRYPNRIQKKYSATQDRVYPMNICRHCGAGQGWYYIYRYINKQIRDMVPLQVVETIRR